MSTPSETGSWWTTDACLAALARAHGLGTADDAERVGRYLAARRRGTDWLLARMRPDGALGDPAAGFEYYRAPWTFGLVGEVEAAHAVCGFVRRNLLTPDGRLDGPLRAVHGPTGRTGTPPSSSVLTRSASTTSPMGSSRSCCDGRIPSAAHLRTTACLTDRCPTTWTSRMRAAPVSRPSRWDGWMRRAGSPASCA